jgi:hypothetical protein
MNQTGAFKWVRSADSASDNGEAFFDNPGVTDSIQGSQPAGEAASPEGEDSGGFFARMTNSLFDGLITPGFDMRFQLAKVGDPPNDTRKFIPMQIAPYLAIAPSQELSIYGGINVGGIVYKAMSKKNATYAGMSDFDVAVQYQPGVILPSIRVGLIQPSIGIRQDDHTAFVRREAGQTGSPLIPPDYNDLGAEVTYEGMHWLTINAGVYNAYYLSQSQVSIGDVSSSFNFSKPSYLVRAVLWPQILKDGLNGEIGASYFANGDFKMVNAFAGIGMADKATVFGEAMYSTNALDRRVRNLSLIGSYLIEQWLSIHWRYDFGQTEYPGEDLYHAQAMVVGAEIFPLPYIELRPEYRFFQRNQFNQSNGSFLGEYTVQLHLFY